MQVHRQESNKDDIFWDHVIWALPLPPNFDNISTFPSILSKIKLASRNVSNYTHLQTDFHSMVMKMLKYCQNLVEDEVLKQYDLKKCLLCLITYSTLILLFIALKLENHVRLKFFPTPCGLVSVLKSIRVFRKQYFSPQVLRVHPMFEVNSGLYIYGLSKWRVLAHFHEIRWKFDFLTAAVACQLTKETLSCVSTSAQTWG